ncbi:heat shock protein HslJ [Sinorhizobium medicae]
MLQALTAASCACVLIELASMQTVAAEKVPEQLVGSWLAEDMGGRGVIDDLQTTLEIREDGTYGGMAGCNHFTGAFSLSGATISFGFAAATRKMCVPAAMDQERKFLNALGDELSWKIEGSKLTLARPNGPPVIRLTFMDSLGRCRTQAPHPRRRRRRAADRPLSMCRQDGPGGVYQCRSRFARDTGDRGHLHRRVERHFRIGCQICRRAVCLVDEGRRGEAFRYDGGRGRPGNPVQENGIV